MKNPFASFFEKEKVPRPAPHIAFGVWLERQPLSRRLPTEEGATIKIKVEDLQRLLQSAYTAGFERASE